MIADMQACGAYACELFAQQVAPGVLTGALPPAADCPGFVDPPALVRISAMMPRTSPTSPVIRATGNRIFPPSPLCQ